MSTGPKEERSSRWKKATEEQLNQGLAAVQLGSHEGFWYEQPDFWSKYLRRPDVLSEMCFAQFARMYKGGKGQNSGWKGKPRNDQRKPKGKWNQYYLFLLKSRYYL